MDDNGFQPQKVIGDLSDESIRLQNDIIKKSLGFKLDDPNKTNTTFQQDQPSEIEQLKAEIAKLKIERMTDSYDFNKNKISYGNNQRKPIEQVSNTMEPQAPSGTTSVQPQQQQSGDTSDIDTSSNNNDLFSSLADIFGNDTKPNVDTPVNATKPQQTDPYPTSVSQQQEQNTQEQESYVLPPEVKGAIDNMNSFSEEFSRAALARGLDPDETLAKVNGMLTVEKILDIYQGVGQPQQQSQVQQNSIAPSLSNARGTTGAIKVPTDPNRVPRGIKKLLL